MPETQDNPKHPSAETIPEFIAHYRILRRLGKGGMGEVFLAEGTKHSVDLTQCDITGLTPATVALILREAVQ